MEICIKTSVDCCYSRGVVKRGAKGAKAFHILPKYGILIAVLSEGKRNFELPSELVIPGVKSREL